MNAPMTAAFETRRDAELAVERLAQELGVDRRRITVGPEGDENSAGETAEGGDAKAAEPSVEARDDGAHAGRILVSVVLDDTVDPAAIKAAFAEMRRP